MPRYEPAAARFRHVFDRATKTEKGCHEWAASRNPAGYGHFRVNGKHVPAHRYSYEFFIGPIPVGMMVLHKCDNPPCVNPEHLWTGTAADNARDRAAKGRGAKEKPSTRRAFCKYGHPRTHDNIVAGKCCRECMHVRTRAWRIANRDRHNANQRGQYRRRRIRRAA